MFFSVTVIIYKKFINICVANALIYTRIYVTILKKQVRIKMHLTNQIKNSVLSFLFVRLGLFLLTFIPVYVLELEEIPQAYSYFTMYTTEIADWFLPCVSAILLLCGSVGDIKSTLLYTLPLTLTNLIYSIPYYYLIGIVYNLDSIESISLSIGVSVLYLVIFHLHTLLLYFISKYLLLKKNNGDAIAMQESGRAFDLSYPLTLSIFSISAIQFLIHLIGELWDAISYFVEYLGDYRTDDIIYMVFRFLFVLAMMFVSHAVCFKVKKLCDN